MQKNPLISIIILTYNGYKTINSVITNIFKQNYSNYEIIAVDSNSNDGTVKILNKYNIKIIHIKKKDFNYGSTKNNTIKNFAKGDIIVFLSQDAISANDYWLSNLVLPLIADEQIAGTFSRQIVNSNVGTNIIEEVNIYKSFPSADRILEKPNLEGIVFSNVSSAVRRDVIIKYPFEKVPFAEDKIWACEIIKKKYKIKYVSDSVVLHSHNHNLKDTFRVAKENGASRKIIYGFKYSLLYNLNKLFNPVNIYRNFKYYKNIKNQLKYSYKDTFFKYFALYYISIIGGLVGSHLSYKKLYVD